MKPKTFPHAPAQALVPGRGGRGRKATPVPPAESVAPETFPHAPQQAQTGTGMPEAPRSAGTDVAPKAASVPSAAAVAPKTFPHPGQAPLGAGTGVAYPAASVPHVLPCEYGHYPWDDWERAALAAGVPKALAGLGRLTMREAYNHDWTVRLKSLCGWRDDGQRMIKLALGSPQTAEKRWQRLLATDGYRGEYDPQTGAWESWT